MGGKVYNFNPLSIVVYYSSRKGLDEFYVEELAKYYKKDKRVIRGAMEDLATKVLICFDSQSDLITLKEIARLLFIAK